MLTEQDLQLLSHMMDQKLAPINQRLDKMDGRLDKMDGRLDKMDGRLDRLEAKVDRIADDVAVNREALESIIEWAEKVGEAIRFPLPKL